MCFLLQDSFFIRIYGFAKTNVGAFESIGLFVHWSVCPFGQIRSESRISVETQLSSFSMFGLAWPGL